MAVQNDAGVVFKKLPGVLSFSRGTVVSDAEFFNEINGETKGSPVKVIRHGIRGTQNVNTSGAGEGSTSGDTGNREISNIQQTDTAKLDPRATALIVRFRLRMLPLLENHRVSIAKGKKDDDKMVSELRQSLDSFVERARVSEGLQEVGRRFARNVLNGRWLWRNRTIATGVTVSVYLGSDDGSREADGGEPFVKAEALDIPLNNFDDYSDPERKLGESIAATIAGSQVNTYSVEARVAFGMSGAIEVFPSQNYIEKKPKGFARPLYRLGHPDTGDPGRDVRVMGDAAIRDQKIANALRTIDTWYEDFSFWGKPIAVEPNGASLEAQKFYRSGKDSSFKLFGRLNRIDPNEPEGMFCIACLLRGGVYSEQG